MLLTLSCDSNEKNQTSNYAFNKNNSLMQPIKHMDKKYELYTKRLSIEDAEDWARWRGEIPYLKFKKSWRVKIIPPNLGAMARFIVRNKKGFEVSVYLDCLDRLGFVSEPYWELYPWIDGDVKRVSMNNPEKFIQSLKIALKSK